MAVSGPRLLVVPPVVATGAAMSCPSSPIPGKPDQSGGEDM